ncbi:zinc finger SWIM domain-containing protein 1 [Varanus komodoensis]|uniref:zinc finger SWIM domain-containing protein 1 n=1 Tax=Varanus komodoensis TaxID=61221 RepID=UPI001CF7A10C|nr:zinc finger SWIM domain-containing protein 1 [Varanus komodoensis]
MALDSLKELQSLDCVVSYQLDVCSQLDSISFQTVLMRDVFSRHPEVVLIHRTHNPWGKALYMFMVDKPFLELEGEMSKVVHFSVPAKETAEGLAHMYRTFKAFNPEWKQIKTFLVDPRFRLVPTLSEAFPSADVQLSVFHICKHLQQKVHQASLEFHTERLVLSVLRNAMCAPSTSNLRRMHRVLSHFVRPGLLPPPHRDWLANDRIWAMHRRRSWGECGRYFRGLEVVTRGLSQVFCGGPSLGSCVTSIARNYQRSVRRRSAEAAPGPATPLGRDASSLHDALQRPLLPREPPPAAQPAAPKPTAEAAAEEAGCEWPAAVTAGEAERLIRQSLSDICTQPAARLCLNELEVVRSSEPLMGAHGDTVHVQLLEEAHMVPQKGLDSCSCHFSRAFQLPCRHILAVLNAEGKELEAQRIPTPWRKGHGDPQPGQAGADGPLEVLRSSWDGLLDKYLAVSFLTAEISRLLSQCSLEEFDRRYSTLRELADSWIGPYVQVKL